MGNNNNIADGVEDCYSLWNCLKFITDYGARSGGGIGDMFRHSVGKRWLMDLIYFLAVIILVFNLVAGVVITTFGRLRLEKNQRTRDTLEVCFICGIDKQIFDRDANDPNGFKIHIRDDHNMWNYLAFMFFIWEQDKDDDDGMEYYVRHRLDANDIDWIPMSKAMRLEQAASVDEQLRLELKDQIAASEGLISARMKKMQINIVTVLEQMTLALKKDHDGDVDDENEDIAFFRTTTATGGEDFTAVTDDGPICRVLLPRCVQLEVVEVSGLRLPSAVMEGLFCRVTTENGGSECRSKLVDVNKSCIIFHSTPILASPNARFDDQRTVEINIIVLAGKNEETGVETGVEEEIIIASISVTLQELVEMDGLCAEKHFLHQENICTLIISSLATISE